MKNVIMHKTHHNRREGNSLWRRHKQKQNRWTEKKLVQEKERSEEDESESEEEEELQ